ncbi:sulfatase [Pelagicoccus sp. SDUM812005]|nr:sulfatase [Pelagicoccus sp. SDUM812005]
MGHLMRCSMRSKSLAVLVAGCLAASASGDQKPNVLFIAVDDLNDWVGTLGGHPQAQTPHIDRLASKGTLFENAHCQSPVCQSSRSSLMTSRFPHRTGIYFLNPDIDGSPALEGVVTLPERFASEGYEVLAGGKLFHNRDNRRIFETIGTYLDENGGFGPFPEEKISDPFSMKLWDWGAFPANGEDMTDDRLARWAVDELQREREDPFFLAVGFYRPHVPMYAPQKWFDLFPSEEVLLPQVVADDRSDLSEYAKNLTTLKHIAPTHQWMEDNGEWQHAVQAYLASIAYVDDCVGRVLGALEASEHYENTIIVLFGDHGFHLGEKERWAKRTLWEDGLRVPLIVSTPQSRKAARANQPVGLIDIYPTLLDLCGFDSDDSLDGDSLVPILADSRALWDRPILSTYGPGNHSVRSERYRYIRYKDGSEELYDHYDDPHEWRNLAGNSAFKNTKEDLAKWIPPASSEHEILGEGSTGHAAYEAALAALELRRAN